MSEYVTVVSVDLQPKLSMTTSTTTSNSIKSSLNEPERKESFVTVLSINNNNQNTTTIRTSEHSNDLVDDGEIITVYRLPGERLGFGLKFQGGTKTSEKVQRLFIQSCDPDSPASKARASWGLLGEGDEILQIDYEPVTSMTRIECVKCLKDKNVAIKLRVKKREKPANGSIKNGVDSKMTKKRPLPPPPPIVPPRKINMNLVPRESNPAPVTQKFIPSEVPIPVEAEMYLNTLDDEINRNDESDETGSTISSQISVISNFSLESELSLMSSNTSSNDLTKLLTKPFQMIEREFNVNSSNVLPSASSMSIDNLLMLNDSEPIEIDEDEKVKVDVLSFTYENINASSNEGVNDDQKKLEQEYENIDVNKLPPIPRPRSMSLPQDVCDINVKTPTKTIESWLNDANTINSHVLNANDKHVETNDHEQNYEPVKFECFAAEDDENDEKLGPPDGYMLNISEAYFNFPWCGNSSSNLPTIGEAEEEFSSIEPTCQHNTVVQKVLKRPIFIVNTANDSESDDCDEKNDVNEANSGVNSQRVDIEINNNDFLYLQKSFEDKSDKNDKRMHHGNKISQSEKTVKSGFSREKLVVSSLRELNKIQAMSVEMKTDENEVNTNLIDESIQSQFDEIQKPTVISPIHQNSKVFIEITKTFNKEIDKSARDEIDNKGMITTDNERLEVKVEKVKETTPSKQMTKKLNEKMMKSKVEAATKTTTESKEMTSLTTSNVHEFISDNKQMEQKPDRTAAESSRMPPDGHEFPLNKLSKKVAEKQMKSDLGSDITIDSIKRSPMPTTKATAIVAPLVPRKMHHFDEITNLVDCKPPFKSATLGRQRPIHWRNKDEKSEKSVKDKIAMFSNSSSDISLVMSVTPLKGSNTNISHWRNGSIAKSTENIFSSGDFIFKSKVNDKFNKKAKSVSVENLDDYDDKVSSNSSRDIQLNYKPVSKTTRHTSSTKTLSSCPSNFNIIKAQSVENLIEPCENPKLPSCPPPTASTLSRRISFSGYSNNQIQENRQKSINIILENRKKSMSKLRGLVIPEKAPENETQSGQKVLGLPVIRSKECELINGRSVSMQHPQSINIMPAKKSFAERRSGFESIQSRVKAAPRRSVEEIKSDFHALKSPPVKPPRTSLIISSHNRTATTYDSDTESCLSSRISSPLVSPVAKKPLTRTLSSETNTSISSNSTLTSGSGSQASCSSNGSTPDGRASKSAEALSSRKSILASSKSRSGRECLEKSWRDEDSTDGGIDNNNERRRVPKAKTRNNPVNYKIVTPNDNFIDKIINVATYVEVVSSDSDDKSETTETFLSPPAPVEKLVSAKTSMTKDASQLNIMSDMAKWVRIEATKANETAKNLGTDAQTTAAKVLDKPKKLNLSEIRKNFENKSSCVTVSPGTIKTPKEKPTSNHNRFSSWDSVASSSSGVSSELLGTGTGTNNSESLQTLQSDFGSFSSFGSSHSLITPQDLQLIIDEADPPLETPEAFVVVLQRETPESSIGITLAGGSDYEAKEITIHRILTNSPADKDGRLKRGDRLLSINGLSMRGLTHRESLSVLKSPRADVVMVVTRSKSAIKTNSLTKAKRGSVGSLTSLTEKNDSLEIDGISTKMKMQASKTMSISMDLEAISNEDCSFQKTDDKNIPSAKPVQDYKANDINNMSIVKDGAGLGFSIDGGYDSPSGNKPLVIKKIFMGGAAQRTSNLKVGDEILQINGASIANQTRIDVWNMIKKLPQGDAVQLTIKRK